MVLTKLYNKKVRETLFDNIMADVKSNSAYPYEKEGGKWISLDMLTDILTVQILRDKSEVVIHDEKER